MHKNLTKYNKIQITDTKIIQFPNVSGYLLQNWFIRCNDKKNNGKIQNFIRSTKQIHQHQNQVQRAYLLSVLLSCI